MVNAEMELAFLPNAADENEGLAHAGIETFRDAPYSSVARECGQNSRDAYKSFPVRITFDQIEITTDQIPAIQRLRSTLDACYRRAEASRDKKELLFFENARALVQASTVKALVISDTGTEGLIGPDSGTPFHSLLKGAGVSNKNSETSGGSFGIGKNAVFAVSDLHTVFYSTLFKDGESLRFLAQGKCILVSHNDKNGSWRATGYWGRENFQPVKEISEAPKWLHRTEVGTSVVSLGFRSTSDWDVRVCESLIRNFFAAVYRGEMEFHINGNSRSVTRDTLASLFDDPEVQAAADRNDSVSELKFSQHLYECLRSAETITKETSITNLGKFQLKILVREGLPKRVCIVRNGMFITDNLQYFGDKLQRFAMYKDFVAILEPADDDSKKWLKLLENPSHDQLSAERLQDSAQREAIRKAMKKLKNWLRQSIKEHTVTATEDSTPIEEMNQFFADVANSERKLDPENGELDPERIKHKRKPTIVKPPPAQGDGTAGGGNMGGGKSSGGTGGVGPNRGSGTGGKGSRGSRGLVPVFDLRNIKDPNSPSRIRKIYLTPGETTVARISIQAAGMSENVPLKIKRLNNSPFRQLQRVQLVAETRMSFEVEFETDFTGPIEVYFMEEASKEEETA